MFVEGCGGGSRLEVDDKASVIGGDLQPIAFDGGVGDASVANHRAVVLSLLLAQDPPDIGRGFGPAAGAAGPLACVIRAPKRGLALHSTVILGNTEFQLLGTAPHVWFVLSRGFPWVSQSRKQIDTFGPQ